MKKFLFPISLFCLLFFSGLQFPLTAYAELCGDVNNDNIVTAVDAMKTLRAAIGLETFTETQKKLADVAPADNPDGAITVVDALLILRTAIGLTTVQCKSSSTNRTPTITSTAVTTATVGTAYSYDVNATDADGDTLTYSLTCQTCQTTPTINSTTGLISWTPTVVGSNNVVVSVSDSKGGTATQSWTISVSSDTGGISSNDYIPMQVGTYITSRSTYVGNATTTTTTTTETTTYIASNSIMNYLYKSTSKSTSGESTSYSFGTTNYTKTSDNFTTISHDNFGFTNGYYTSSYSGKNVKKKYRNYQHNISKYEGTPYTTPLNFTFGQTWINDYTLRRTDYQPDPVLGEIIEEWVEKYNEANTVEKFETITIGSKTYKDAAKIKKVIQHTTISAPTWYPKSEIGKTTTYTYYYWYAQGMGQVKYESSDSYGTSYSEIISYGTDISNIKPFAFAGVNENNIPGETASLNTVAKDIANRPLTYAWQQKKGASVTLSNQASPNPAFIPSSQGEYSFELTVSNGSTVSDADTVEQDVFGRETAYFPAPDYNSSDKIAVSPDNKKIFIFRNDYSNQTAQLSVVDTTSKTEVGKVQFSKYFLPTKMVASTDGKLYLFDGSNIKVVDTNTYSVLKELGGGSVYYSGGIALSSDGKQLYVINSNTVEILETTNFSSLKKGLSINFTSDLIISKNDKYLYGISMNYSTGKYAVVKLDASTLQEISKISLSRPDYPFNFFLSSDETKIFLPYLYGGQECGSGLPIVTVDLTTGAELPNTINVTTSYISNIISFSDLNLLYVDSNSYCVDDTYSSDSVVVINYSTGLPIGYIAVGNYSYNSVLSNDRSKIYFVSSVNNMPKIVEFTVKK